jgi:hypothetical protein
LEARAKGLGVMRLSIYRRVAVCAAIGAASLCAPYAFCQTTSSSGASTGGANRVVPAKGAATQEELPRRLFGIIPNYRSHPSFKDSKPLTSKEKFKLGLRDSFDPGTFVLAGGLAGIAQASNSIPSYGQGMAGYGRYYGATFGNLVIGNMMTVAVFPSLLHQDPRYFRRGGGSTWSRLGYACGQIFITHGDNRKTQFNYSEVFGNATAVAISNAYIPDNRTASDAVGQLGMQLGLDMAGNILKEFVPDMYRKISGKKHH